MVWQISCCCENTHVTCVLQKKSTQGWFGRPHPDRKTHMCAITRVWPTNKYTCVSQNKYTQGCTQGFKESRNTRVWRRPVAAVSIHMCVAEEVNSGLHKDQGLQGRGRPGAAASTHMCVSEKTAFIQGCTQGSTVVWGRPTNCCCEHTHVCVAESHLNSRLAPRIKKVQEFGRPTAAASIHICVSETVPGCTQGSQVTRDWPTNCCCEHTRVCCRVYQFRVAPISVKGYNGLADQLLLREHACDMCVAEKTTQGWFGRPHPEERTHMCAAKYKSFEGCTQGQGLQLQGVG